MIKGFINGLKDRIKSPLICDELIKTIQVLDNKSLKDIAEIIHKMLDVQLVDEDIRKVKVEIALKLDFLKRELLKK